MKKITIMFFAGCVALVVGCHWVGIRGNGNIKTDQRTISAFTNLDAGGAFLIEWQNGAFAWDCHFQLTGLNRIATQHSQTPTEAGMQPANVAATMRTATRAAMRLKPWRSMRMAPRSRRGLDCIPRTQRDVVIDCGR